MKNVFVIVPVLTGALAIGSCHVEFRRKTVAPIISPPVQESPILTLSADQLVFLDWDGGSASRAKVVRKRVAGASAVEFDLYFPSNEPGSRALNYVSSGSGGRGKLIACDVSAFDTFSLKFTLVSVDGVPGSDEVQELAVGALIGPTAAGKLSTTAPVTLGTSPGRETAVSSVPVAVDRIYQIGFHVNMVNPEKWRPSGSRATIRVEPVEGATLCPWPAEN